MDNKKKGKALEQSWIDHMTDTIQSKGAERSKAEALANLMVGDVDSGQGFAEGRNLLNKPMYEELNKYPFPDQLNTIRDHVQSVDTSPEAQLRELQRKKYLEQLAVGQSYS